MSRLPSIPLFILILCLIITTGCTSPADTIGATANNTPDGKQIMSAYQQSVSQPDITSDFIRMDTDIYNAGEVVEFVVTNNGLLPLTCSNTPPDFRVTFQAGNGRWATKMGPDVPVPGNISHLQKGESTRVYRFISTAWDAGRYRIVSDCGVERDFLIRVLPTPAPTATPCSVNNTADTTPWIKIDPIDDQYDARPFTIHGTTNLPVRQELQYTIFSALDKDQAASLEPLGSFTTFVEEGSCGTNTWNAMGEIQATGDFFIGISDTEKKATAIKRFSVYLS
ncbi:MAG: hypothetical protein M0Q92_10110 [Methanoregula sp.]|jgi:hypothetical protein|nr:hypothetical protein [Methanoregula sp.]